jgi:hypothetical protein
MRPHIARASAVVKPEPAPGGGLRVGTLFPAVMRASRAAHAVKVVIGAIP